MISGAQLNGLSFSAVLQEYMEAQPGLVSPLVGPVARAFPSGWWSCSYLGAGSAVRLVVTMARRVGWVGRAEAIRVMGSGDARKSARSCPM